MIDYANIDDALRSVACSREVFLSKVMPYKWMPRFVNATDSSARTLKIYNKVSNNSVAPRSDNLEAVASRKCNRVQV